MAKKTWKQDFISKRLADRVSELSLFDIQSPWLFDEHDINSARSILSSSKTLQTIILEPSGAGLRFHSWATRLASELDGLKYEASDFDYLDRLPVEATPLIVLETRLLGELTCLHNEKKIQLSANISGFKMLTGSGLDKRMLALSALVSPASIDAYQHGPCGSLLWHVASGGKQELQEVCNHFYKLTGFSRNDLYCTGVAKVAFWQALFKYIPELFFSFYAALIALYRLGENRRYKRLASDMLEHKNLTAEDFEFAKPKPKTLTPRQQSIVDSQELIILSKVSDTLVANTICRVGIGLDLPALFGMEKSESKHIADEVVGDGFCSSGAIDAALKYNFWKMFVSGTNCKHDLELREGSLHLMRSEETLGQAAIAAWRNNNPLESVGLAKYFLG